MLEEKDLAYEMITEFSYVLIMSADNPMASKEVITFDDLTSNCHLLTSSEQRTS